MSSINHILENLRHNYLSAELDKVQCDKNPLLQFDKWFNEALNAKCDEPNAFTLSTVSNGQPHGRVVLLKSIHSGKFVFYTNYNSSKSKEMDQNSKVAATFLWLQLQRQIRIEGTVTKLEDKLSDEYFAKRPRGSQIGAIASPQSSIIPDRKYLEELFSNTEKKNSEFEKLDRPANWGGFEIEPHYIEFWQGRSNRMHDRISYIKNGSEWKIQRLAP